MDTTGATESAKSSDESRMTDQLASAAHNTIDRAAEKAAKTERDARAAAAKVVETARSSEERARESIGSTVDSAASYVRENPLLSAGIAFVAGVALSSLLRR